MGNLILTLLILLTVGISVLVGFLRGLGKARIRGIAVLVSAVAAVLVTVLTRGSVVSDSLIQDTVIPWLQAMEQSEIADMLGMSPTLNATLLNTAYSLIAPILCVAFFLIFSFLTWLAYAIVTLILGGTLREQNENSKYPRTRAIVWGLIQGFVIVAIWLIPVSTYLSIAPPAAEAVINSGVLGEDEAPVQEILDSEILPMNKNALLVTYRALGGNGLSSAMTNFKINDTKVRLDDEIDSIADFACNIIKLTEKKIEEYGATESAVIMSIADSFEDSVLLPTIAGEVIYNVTDAWLNDKSFMGLSKPELGEMEELFTPFLETLLTVLKNDARNTAALQADFRTVAELISTLSTHGVFSNLSNTEGLMESLSSQGIINSMITALGSNQSMKILIPEITNMGVRAIATTLGIPSDVQAVYGSFLDEVATSLNNVKRMDESLRVGALSAKLTNAFDNAGIPIDKEIIDCYSVSMVEDLINGTDKNQLTADDIQAFFTVYAMSVAQSTAEASDNNTSGLSATKPLSATDPFAGTVYEGKTEDELKNSGAAVLAAVTQKLAAIDPEGDIAEQAKTILTETYVELLGENSDALEKLAAIEVTKPVSSAGVEATASLQSSDEMVTVVVTLADLLVDTQQAAENITADTLEQESAAISAIFSAANDLTKQDTDGGDIDVTKVAGTVGSILDSLNDTQSFGSEKTANLFTAVMQSETVRNSADMDMQTATQMAGKATEGGGNYSQTMNAVSSGIDVFTKLGNGKEKLTDEELVQLIRDINPQTAGMIEIYVTPERIVGYGVPTEYSGTSAELLSTTFSYLAHAALTEEEFDKEAKALNQVLTVAITANSHSSGRKLFGEVLPSATETVDTFMASKSLGYSLRTVMLDENGNVKEGKYDAFNLSERIPETSPEYRECFVAMHSYYQAAPTEENYLTLKAMSALFGVPFIIADEPAA